MDIEAVKRILIQWAATKPLVGRLWIFGSRARQDYRPDSDLDIAIELDLAVANNFDKSGGLLTWSLVEKGWAEEIHQLAGLPIDLNQYLRDFVLSDIPEKVAKSNILVFAKPQLSC